MRTSARVALSLLVAGSQFACCLTRPAKLSLPGETITLDAAIVDVSEALETLQRGALAADDSSGLVPSEVVVSFQIASATKEGMTIDLNVLEEVGFAGSTERADGKANTITITLRNILFADHEELLSLVAKSDGLDLVTLFDQLRRAGVHPSRRQ